MVRRLLAAVAVVALVSAPSSTLALGKNKALYIGSNSMNILQGGTAKTNVLTAKIEGSLDVTSPSGVLFDGGRWGSLSIPWAAISHVEYGLKASRRAPRLFQRIPWDPFVQYTKDAHYVLTIVFDRPDGDPQAVVLELGESLVRPALEAFERHTGTAVAFDNVEVCVQYKTADACGYGSPAELKGLKRIFLEDVRDRDRELISAELSREDLGLQIVDDAAGAEVVLTYDADWSLDPGCPCEGGRGQIVDVRGATRRTLFVFTGAKKGIWGTQPATGFGRAVVGEFKRANSAK